MRGLCRASLVMTFCYNRGTMEFGGRQAALGILVPFPSSFTSLSLGFLIHKMESKEKANLTLMIVVRIRIMLDKIHGTQYISTFWTIANYCFHYLPQDK